jgi:hypothetical protein
MDWCGLLPGLVHFRLVVHPLQPGVVELYHVRGTCFSNHLPLEGIMSYHNFGTVTGGPRYLWYKTPT